MLVPEAIRHSLKSVFMGKCESIAGQPPDAAELRKTAEMYGHYIPHALDEKPTRGFLIGAGRAAGLTERKAQKAVDDGLATGMADPKAPPVNLLGESDIADKVKAKLLNREADKRVAAIVAEENPAPPMEAGIADDLILTLGEEDPERVENLIPAEGRLLIVAMRKTGKTTFVLNLSKSLITGEPFLGRLGVRPIKGRVGILNYEVSGRTFIKWLEEAGVPLDRVFLANLRGKQNPLLTEQGRADLAKQLKEANVEVLIVDPFGRAYKGKSQNDAAEVTPWLVDLDQLASDAGCSEVVLSAHAGWNGEHTRGSSALEDWPDTIAWMTRNERDERFLKSEGRMDEDLHEDRLDWDPGTRTLSLSGIGGKAASAAKRRATGLVDPCVEIVRANPGITVRKIEELLKDDGHKFKNGDVGKALKEAVESCVMRVEDGPRNARMHYLVDLTDDECSPA